MKHYTHPFVPSARGNGLSLKVVCERATPAARVAGISANVPQRFFVTHVLPSSREPRAVQELPGHARFKAAQVYSAPDFQHLAHVHDQAHPRAKKRD